MIRATCSICGEMFRGLECPNADRHGRRIEVARSTAAHASEPALAVRVEAAAKQGGRSVSDAAQASLAPQTTTAALKVGDSISGQGFPKGGRIVAVGTAPAQKRKRRKAKKATRPMASKAKKKGLARNKRVAARDTTNT